MGATDRLAAVEAALDPVGGTEDELVDPTEEDGEADGDEVVGLAEADDTVLLGAAACPPTLAHDVSNTAVAAIEASQVDRPRPRTARIRVGSGARRVVGRPCDMSSFCQSG